MNIPQSAIGSFPGRISGPSAGIGFIELDEETFLEVRWAEDPRLVEQSILQVADYLEDLHKPMLAAAAIASHDIQNHFDSETDPEGNHWQELDSDYLVRKESLGFDTRILRRSGDLEEAATRREAMVVTGNELFYSTEGLPYYWYYMQVGTGNAENVGLAGDYRATARALSGTDVESDFGPYGIGSGKATPARPFLGLSYEAEDEIFTIFDLWFAAGTSIFIHETGRVQSRLPSGQFGPSL